ncbi:hypothetical protein N7488_006570 [Penicillium malachiteum]|nr:hypothetical protein N7488_006570 [Penicillium malachiteum]
MSSTRSIPQRRNRSASSPTNESESSVQPPRSNSKRPRLGPTNDATSSEETSGDDEEASDESDDDANTGPTSAQRPSNQRRNLSSEDESEDVEAEQRQRPKKERWKSLQSSESYKPGAIVRIKMTNFVTYKSAEFFPGPKLNMVIGPNGTGKSTLVCAICLGLGWGPQHLGRAKDIGEFVKHENQEARIEIELQGHRGAPNPVITRTIQRDGNKSSFTLNGHRVTKDVVAKLAEEYAIQVDNLCQFLPQDKVAEFAALKPIDLLRSTERAAGGEEMLSLHDNLNTLRQKQKEIELNNRGEKEMLNNLEDRQEMQRADVERMRQRAEIQKKIENLEHVRPWVEYVDYHRQFSEIKEKTRRTEQEYDQLKKDLEPALAAVHAKEEYASQINHVKDLRKQQVEQLSKFAETCGQKIENLDQSFKQLENQVEAEKKSLTQTRSDATNVKQRINRLKRQQEQEVVEFDPDHYNEKSKQLRLEMRDIETKAEGINGGRTLGNQLRDVQQQINREEQQLKNLDSQLGQQENALSRISPDTLKAYRWLKKNQDKFEKEVFGPPVVTCSVVDSQYAPAVESLLNRTDLTAFTTQSRNDFRTLQRILDRDLKLSDISIKTCSSTNILKAAPPLSNDNLRRLGLEAWAKDLIQGPDTVIAMLCNENSFHKTPIGRHDISEEVFNELEANKDLTAWVSGKRFYNVARRADLGDWATSTRTRNVKPAQVWTSMPLDTSVKDGHRATIRDLEVRKEQIETEMEGERSELRELQTQMERVKREMKANEAEKAQKQSAFGEFRAIPGKLAQEETKMQSLTKLFEEIREQVVQIRIEQDEIAIKKAEAVVVYADAVEKLTKAHEELVKNSIRYIEAISDLQILRSRNSEHGKLLEEKSLQMQQAQAEFQQARTKGKSMRSTANRIRDEVSGKPEWAELWGDVTQQDYNIDALNADIESAKAHLELTQGGSANMIQEFEERERKIERLRQKLASFQEQLDGCQAAINEVRQRWEPRLDALICKISAAFSDSFQRIGCAGQVTLDKVEAEAGPNGAPGGSEFQEWSILIHVKFREIEELSVLNSHRQSGGERAVSTIFYLMALQSLSASPFRVVDEINQGMDPRNERMVHGRLVDIACASEEGTDDEGNSVGGGGGGQYFLITPKLLTGLTYKPGMRVLCIWSGEHVPEDSSKLNMSAAIRKMRKITRTRQARAAAMGSQHSQVDIAA